MKTITFKPFSNSFKRKMFCLLQQQLKRHLTNALLIGNYRIGSFDFDAIVITPSDVFIFQFTEEFGETFIVNDAEWINEKGCPVFAGARSTSPWEQLRGKRNILHRKIMNSASFIKTVLVMPQVKKLVKGETSLNLDNHRWFLVSQPEAMIHNIENNISMDEVNYQRLVRFFKGQKLLYVYNRVLRMRARLLSWMKNIHICPSSSPMPMAKTMTASAPLSNNQYKD